MKNNNAPFYFLAIFVTIIALFGVVSCASFPVVGKLMYKTPTGSYSIGSDGKGVVIDVEATSGK